jgi:amino acid permease
MSGDTGLSVLGAAASVMACIIGIGLITLPTLFARAGWIGGTCILAGLAAFLLLLCLLLAQSVLASSSDSRSHKPLTTYRAVAEWALGRLGGWTLAVVMYVEYTLFLSLLILILSDEVRRICFNSAIEDHLLSVSIATCVMLPFSLVSKAKILEYFSILGLLGTSLLSGLVVVKGVMEAQSSVVRADTVMFAPFDAMSWALSASNICLVYAASGIVPTIMGGMRDPYKFPKVAKLVFTLSTVFYLAIGYAGYAAWGSAIASQDLLELLKDGSWSDIPTTVSLVMISIPQYAITALVLNNGMDEIIPRRSLHIPVRVSLVFAEACLAYYVNTNLSGLLNVISSCTCVILVVLFPVLIYWYLKQKTGKARLLHHVFTGVSVLFGMIIIVVGTQAALASFK